VCLEIFVDGSKRHLPKFIVGVDVGGDYLIFAADLCQESHEIFLYFVFASHHYFHPATLQNE
jgi:hypothetical protein